MSVARRSQMPVQALFYITAITLASLSLLLAACTRSVSTEPYVKPTSGTPQNATTAAPIVSIEDARVTQGEGIYITGHAALADGECIKTNLLAGGQAAAWWPKDICVQVDAGQWEMLVSLGRSGAPQQLDPKAAYTLQAWWPNQEQATLTQFPLNLNGPKKP